MPVFVEESNLPTLTKAGVLKYLLQKVIMKATHSIFLFFRILCHFDYHLRAPCSICDFGDLERQWALPVTILWLPLLSGFGGGWRQRGRQIKYLIPFIRQDINRSTVFQQRFQSPFPWSASCPIPNIIIRPHRSIFIISVINGHHDGKEHDHRHQRRFPR